jgi:hypothetical protein
MGEGERQQVFIMSGPFNLNLTPEAQRVFDALGGGFARGGELFRRAGIEGEDRFVAAVRELSEKDLVNVQGEVAPSTVMLAVISARPSAYDLVQRSKRAW